MSRLTHDAFVARPTPARLRSVPALPPGLDQAVVNQRGLAPDAVEGFVQKYPGYRTATVQSAFRYDYPEEVVRAGIQCLSERLPQSEARHREHREGERNDP